MKILRSGQMLDLAGTLLGLGVSMSGGKNKIFGLG